MRATNQDTQAVEDEWVGGTKPLPVYVANEGSPYRPESVLWMNGEGLILGTVLCHPGEALEVACESLRDTMRAPMTGEPHVPKRIRVASAGLAAVLRSAHPEIEIVCAPTPELDAIVSEMGDALTANEPEGITYLTGDLEPAAMASMFRAAAELYRAAPWASVPSDQDLISVSVEAFGLHDVALSVIGQMGQSRGFVMFESLEAFDAFLDAASVQELDGMPAHMSLNFDSADELPAGPRQEAETHGWEVASADAYPWAMIVDDDQVPRPATAKELASVEAVARGITLLLEGPDAPRDAWDGGEPVSRTFTVPTHAGDVEVTLRAPYA